MLQRTLATPIEHPRAVAIIFGPVALLVFSDFALNVLNLEFSARIEGLKIAIPFVKIAWLILFTSALVKWHRYLVLAEAPTQPSFLLVGRDWGYLLTSAFLAAICMPILLAAHYASNAAIIALINHRMIGIAPLVDIIVLALAIVLFAIFTARTALFLPGKALDLPAQAIRQLKPQGKDYWYLVGGFAVLLISPFVLEYVLVLMRNYLDPRPIHFVLGRPVPEPMSAITASLYFVRNAAQTIIPILIATYLTLAFVQRLEAERPA